MAVDDRRNQIIVTESVFYHSCDATPDTIDTKCALLKCKKLHEGLQARSYNARKQEEKIARPLTRPMRSSDPLPFSPFPPFSWPFGTNLGNKSNKFVWCICSEIQRERQKERTMRLATVGRHSTMEGGKYWRYIPKSCSRVCSLRGTFSTLMWLFQFNTIYLFTDV